MKTSVHILFFMFVDSLFNKNTKLFRVPSRYFVNYAYTINTITCRIFNPATIVVSVCVSCCLQEKLEFWDNVYGYDMSCIKKLAI